MGEPVKVPSADASRAEWARYFLASAEKDVVFQQEQIAWTEEQIEYHRRKLHEYREGRKQVLARLEAARAEVEKWTGLVDDLD